MSPDFNRARRPLKKIISILGFATTLSNLPVRGKYSRMMLNGNYWPERLYSPSIVVFANFPSLLRDERLGPPGPERSQRNPEQLVQGS